MLLDLGEPLSESILFVLHPTRSFKMPSKQSALGLVANVVLVEANQLG
jgi:hypothetical protein